MTSHLETLPLELFFQVVDYLDPLAVSSHAEGITHYNTRGNLSQASRECRLRVTTHSPEQQNTVVVMGSDTFLPLLRSVSGEDSIYSLQLLVAPSVREKMSAHPSRRLTTLVLPLGAAHILGQISSYCSADTRQPPFPRLRYLAVDSRISTPAVGAEGFCKMLSEVAPLGLGRPDPVWICTQTQESFTESHRLQPPPQFLEWTGSNLDLPLLQDPLRIHIESSPLSFYFPANYGYVAEHIYATEHRIRLNVTRICQATSSEADTELIYSKFRALCENFGNYMARSRSQTDSITDIILFTDEGSTIAFEQLQSLEPGLREIAGWEGRPYRLSNIHLSILAQEPSSVASYTVNDLIFPPACARSYCT